MDTLLVYASCYGVEVEFSRKKERGGKGRVVCAINEIASLSKVAVQAVMLAAISKAHREKS